MSAPRGRGLGRRRRGRLRKVLAWGFLFVASVLAGAIAFAYTYITDSETLAALIRDEAPRYLPNARVDVDKVLLRPLVGDVELKQTTVSQDVDGKRVATLHIPWLQVRSDFRALLSGRPTMREVVVARPTLRLMRRKDGTWNLQGLLADPFPQTKLAKPSVTISRGEVVLADGTPVMNEVTLRVEPISDGSYKFEGDARGKAFERLALAGTFHPKTGRLVLSRGDLSGLVLSESLAARMPESVREPLKKLGLEGGELNVSTARLVRDPAASPPLDYEVHVGLRSGTWKCPKLPFHLTDFGAALTASPNRVRIEHAAGINGNTVVRVSDCEISARDPENGPMHARVRVENLELDERLREKTPEKLKKLWSDFSPPGRKNLGQVHATVRASRARPGEEIQYETDVEVLDVAIRYHEFRYPLEHIRGHLAWSGKAKTVTVDAATAVAGKPLTGKGTIRNPGPNAVVDLAFHADAMPIDKTLLDALPTDVRQVVEDFHPEGTARGDARLIRTPSAAEPKGHVEIHAELELNENCSMSWKGLPYPVRNLTGHLSLHPDNWTFTRMRGSNNLAEIAAHGRVIQVDKARKKFDVDITLEAHKLPFDDQLRRSLPSEWGDRTWAILNPTGTASIAGRIRLAPGRPDDYEIGIRPEPGASVQLRLTPAPGTETASGADVIVLPPMQGVTGGFVYHNGLVTMKDVGFTFRQAPAHFASGQVRVQNSGAFSLGVEDLGIKGLRLEYELRKIMPPVMADFARRLDDGKTFTARGDMTIGWTGVATDPATCSWKNARVIFNDNSIAAGIPLEHIQGELRNLSGQFDGRTLGVEGAVYLDSVNVRGQHLTNFSSPLTVREGHAALPDIQADFLGGKMYGNVGVTLDTTPKYDASMTVAGARLEKFAETVAGHQDYKGELNARVEINGLGQDPKDLKGQGEAHVTHGDLGKLPIFLDLIQPLNLPRQGRTKFDAADVAFSIENGVAALGPIKFTSDSVSLQGHGTVGHLGALDLRFTPLPGRDERIWLRGLRDAIHKVEGQFLVIHVGGTASAHRVKAEFLPVVSRNAVKVIRKLGDRGDGRP